MPFSPITDRLVDGVRVALCPDRFTEGSRSVRNRSSGAQEAPHSNEVVRDHAQGEYPTDQGQPFHLDLPNPCRRPAAEAPFVLSSLG
jgi:hypothetical protein